MQYARGHVLALIPETATTRWAIWHRHLSGTVGPVSGGVSAAGTSNAGLDSAQAEALSALNLGERLHGPALLTAYADVFVPDYATSLVENRCLRQAYETVIGKLASVEQPDRAELLSTLDEVLPGLAERSEPLLVEVVLAE